MSKKVAVIIPCYNEAKTIKKVIDDTRKNLPSACIYVYDNNSTDDTYEIALKCKDEIQASGGSMFVEHEYKQGKGNVIRTAFREIEADCYIIIDGDDTYPLENITNMVDMVINKKVDMVVGDRLSSTYFQENKRPFHNLGNKTVRFLVNKLFHSDIKDIMSGYRAFGYNFVKSFPIVSKGFEIETEMTIHALDKNFYVEQIPVMYRDRPKGSCSKLNTFSDGIKVLTTIFKLFKDYKPFLFFGYLTGILMIIAMYLFIPIYIEFKATSLVNRFPTLIVSGFIFLAAIQSFICGLILDTESRHAKKNFEMQLNIIQLLKEKC